MKIGDFEVVVQFDPMTKQHIASAVLGPIHTYGPSKEEAFAQLLQALRDLLHENVSYAGKKRFHLRDNVEAFRWWNISNLEGIETIEKSFTYKGIPIKPGDWIVGENQVLSDEDFRNAFTFEDLG